MAITPLEKQGIPSTQLVFMEQTTGPVHGPRFEENDRCHKDFSSRLVVPQVENGTICLQPHALPSPGHTLGRQWTLTRLQEGWADEVFNEYSALLHRIICSRFWHNKMGKDKSHQDVITLHAQNINLGLNLEINLYIKREKLILSPPTSNKNLKFPQVES